MTKILIIGGGGMVGQKLAARDRIAQHFSKCQRHAL